MRLASTCDVLLACELTTTTRRQVGVMSTLAFWKPGTVRPGSSVDRASEAEGDVLTSKPSSSSLGIQSQRERLPIYKHRNELLYCIEHFGVVIVHAQTGAGKTTHSSIPLRKRLGVWRERHCLHSTTPGCSNVCSSTSSNRSGHLTWRRSKSVAGICLEIHNVRF